MLRTKITPLVLLFLCSCASIVSPTGGPKDTTPPVCTKQIPAANTTRFNEKKIAFVFDEFVVLNDVTNQFIMSPPMEKNPEIKVVGKRIEIEFKEALLPNTTYTLNFGNSIADYNESNPLQGLTYTFSTGDYIDSLKLNGSVKDAFTLLPDKNIAVALYQTKDDSTIFKTKPSYLVRPDSTGNFKFNYLRPAEYELIAFEDINKNLKIETNEKVGFYSTKINLAYNQQDSSSTAYNLMISPQPSNLKPQVITAKEKSKGKYEVIVSGSNCKLFVEEPGANKKATFIQQVSGKLCDTLMLYTDINFIDSVILPVTIDTVVENTTITCRSKQYDKFKLTSQENILNYDFSKPLSVGFTNPVTEIRKQLVHLKEDSTEVTDFTLTNDSINPLLFHVNKQWKDDNNYTLIFSKGAIKDLFGQECDSTIIQLKTAPSTAFGNLTINVDNKPNTNLIVQLLDNQNTIVKEQTIDKSQDITYQNLFPGQYFIKVIEDANKNGRWDGANYPKKQQAERVFITPQSIEVRANWDLTDIKIVTGF
ncbi:Ig-like domain-containing protein [Oscillatoria amoena NRMC-F 0135]|nr:Ig-like domain-containing protein [Oscillatoria amoena NRMC-F 0135]